MKFSWKNIENWGSWKSQFFLSWPFWFFLYQNASTSRILDTSPQGLISSSQYFFMNISWIGPWVSRVEWCQGHWCGSIYLVVRLSDVSSKIGKTCIFCVFMPFLGLYWTASQPDMLSHINAQSKDQSMKFFEKKIIRHSRSTLDGFSGWYLPLVSLSEGSNSRVGFGCWMSWYWERSFGYSFSVVVVGGMRCYWWRSFECPSSVVAVDGDVGPFVEGGSCRVLV